MKFVEWLIGLLVVIAMFGTVVGAFQGSMFWGGVTALGWAFLIAVIVVQSKKGGSE